MESRLRQFIFPKKSGTALAQAAPFVNEVYAQEYPHAAPLPKLDASAKSGRAVRLGKVLHMTVHSIPSSGRLVRIALLAAFTLAWLVFYPTATKVLTVACGLVYSLIETMFTYVRWLVGWLAGWLVLVCTHSFI